MKLYEKGQCKPCKSTIKTSQSFVQLYKQLINEVFKCY